jgi:Cu+-exporting ATPase
LKKMTVKIAGMSCSTCAGRIEKALMRIPGVEGAGVNFSTETATVDYFSELVSAETIFDKIKETGCRPVTGRIEFRLSGMSCAACASCLHLWWFTCWRWF